MAEFMRGLFMLVALFSSVYTSETHCNTTNQFGPDCSFMCHCLNNEQCDVITGSCSSGCDFDWVGPACQHRNIILSRSKDETKLLSRHSSNTAPVTGYSLKANDVNLGSCSYTNYANKSTRIPWWKVWFDNNKKIAKLVIVTKESGLGYFRGFTVLVSNVSSNDRFLESFPNEVVCYTHNDTAPQKRTIYVTCYKPIIGNHIRIKLATKQSQLVLCDVRVYGECQNKTYGDSCTKRCSRYCEDICDTDNGECHTCGIGWFGSRCDRSTCDDQHFGINCTEICSLNCADICDEMNGTCSTCKHGWTGSQCRKECSKGTYGQNCANDCSPHCRNVCNKTNGSCSNKCSAGYEGDLCNKMCPAGFFGDECKQICSTFCVQEGSICNNENGTCLSGCVIGRKGPRCDEECEDGEYGKNCAFVCSRNCKDDSGCNKGNGTCMHGCRAGYLGHNCSTICQDRTYGKDCSLNCSKNCLKGTHCLHTNGSCLNGCDPGWTGDTCNNACQIGIYGDDCALNCSINCFNGSVCLHTNGSCIDGCEPGWTGDKCNDACQNGTYGDACAFNCSTHCLNGSVCLHLNGTCKDGCDPGWTGDRCKYACQKRTYGQECAFNCSDHCLNGSVCLHTDGLCEDGCEPGWTGDTCVDECQNKTYGHDCSSNCSLHCLNGSECLHTDGSCLYGCDPGWTGTNCDDKCPSGSYGAECGQNCSGHCYGNSACWHTNGSCLFGCTDGWKGNTCWEELAIKETQRSTVYVAAGVSVALVIIIVSVFISLLFCKRKDLFVRFFKKKGKEETFFHNEIYQNSQTDTYVNGDIDIQESVHDGDHIYGNDEDDMENCTMYYNVGPVRRTPFAISVADIAIFVKEKINVEGYFTTQFENIATGLLHPALDAERPENKLKNRFRKIFPYDHSRVILKELPGKPGSDFINASFIKGVEKEKAYIASQGPVEDNVVEFWRMIWEVDIKEIVMLTNVIEQGKIKCNKYWGPQGSGLLFGSIHVTMVNEEVYAEFVVRIFKVSQKDDKNATREITQYHYTAWPDKDVPKTTFGLLQFWRKVRKEDENKEHTWLVHCSAGVGRTGTFIALDLLYDQGKNLGYIDVYQCVKELRDQRVNLVQTPNQYLYLHLLMLEIFCLPSKPISVDEFTKEYMTLQQEDKNSGKTELLKEYETLEVSFGLSSVSVVSMPDQSSGKTTAIGSGKNEPIAHEINRPFLSTYTPGSPNLIVAAYVPSFRSLVGYIIAQYPLKNTKMETCRLVFEKSISIVITFPNHEQPASKLRQILFEEFALAEGEAFVVHCKSQTETQNYTTKVHTLLYQGKEHRFTEIIFKRWSSSSLVPETTDGMLKFLEEVDQQNEATDKTKPILIQCWNGVERSGLMTVLMNIFDRARFDNEVSIPQVIRQLRLVKKDIIPNFEQYRFCYDLLCTHLENSNVYANV